MLKSAMFVLDNKTLEDIVVARHDRLVKKLNQPGSLVMRSLIMCGLKDMEIFKKPGLSI